MKLLHTAKKSLGQNFLVDKNIINKIIKIGNIFDLGAFYDISLIIILLFMIYHQFLIKKRQKMDYFKAFINNHFIGMTVSFGIFLSIAI